MIEDTGKYPFLAPIESQWESIRDEYLQVKDYAMEWHEKDIYSTGWTTLGLYFKGEHLTDNQRMCPVTSSLIKKVPGLFICGFSIMKPGCVIHPHVGYTDKVLRSHLGLICPDNCYLTVENNTKSWKEGEMFVFDDTLMHSARNESDSDRVVLILDFLRQ